MIARTMVVSAVLWGAASAQTGPVVQTEAGAVRGTATATVAAFKNIPYAAPPVGDARWRPPQRAVPWEGERDATALGDRCAQIDTSGKISGSEDCLYLNVWAPVDPGPEGRPVLVWIHGGALARGTAMTKSTDGERLVDRTGVVVVSINYRLGQFGYLPHPALFDESGTMGNYGLLDQLAALEWVQRNIAAFGGDPRRVAIFGQSAGGFSVCSLVASPRAGELFSAAIMMSGGCTARPWNDGVAAGQRFASAAGCGDAAEPVACLRGMTMESVLRALPPDTGYATVIDGYGLTGQPEQTIARGRHRRVPVMVGNTSEEEGGTGAGIATAADFEGAVLKVFPYPTALPLVVQQYPLWEYESARAAYVAFASDMKYACPARRAARALAAGQSEPVYRYVFSHVRDGATEEVRAQGAKHASDVPYVFDQLSGDVSDGERGLVEAFGRAFSALAASGRVDWPLYDVGDPFLWLDSEIRAGDGFRRRQCDFWDWLVAMKP